ncbi:MAG: DNA polymerase III subunit epsilon [Rhodospirillaceae bacterium]
MREIVLDTETTGFKAEDGHRIIEIGCVELFNHLPTGGRYHQYINPEREVPADAVKVHGLTAAFLAPYPKFAEIARAFLDFMGDAPLVAHNAQFDTNFLNAELKRLGLPPITHNRQVVDTIPMARRKFPGAQASLDALCRRFGIDNSNRSQHGALIDASLLAEVYLELLGGRQTGLALESAAVLDTIPARARNSRTPRPPRVYPVAAEEIAAHTALLKKLQNPLWLMS